MRDLRPLPKDPGWAPPPSGTRGQDEPPAPLRASPATRARSARFRRCNQRRVGVAARRRAPPADAGQQQGGEMKHNVGRSVMTMALAGTVAAATMVGATATATFVATSSNGPGSPVALATAAALYKAIPPTPARSTGGGTDNFTVSATAVAKNKHPRLDWEVGFARESLDPTPAMLAAGFHLGGYGLGPTRPSTGPLVDGDGRAGDRRDQHGLGEPCHDGVAGHGIDRRPSAARLCLRRLLRYRSPCRRADRGDASTAPRLHR